MAPIRSTPFLRGNAARPGFMKQNHRTLLRELHSHNENEEMVTYDVATASWTPWTRPVRVLQSGALTAVAASGFNNLPTTGPDQYAPPICPHAADLSNDEKFSRMELFLRRKYQGRVVDYFQVPRSSHICPFVVVIPPLQPPQVLYTQQEIDEHSIFYSPEEAAEMQEISHVYDRDLLQGFTSSSSPSKASSSSFEAAEGVGSSSSGSLDASFSFSSPGTNAMGHHRLFPSASARNDPRMPGYNPRMLPNLTFAEGPLPSPRPISAAGRRASSFFTEEVANARRSSDVNLMSHLDYNEKVGMYESLPGCHPAWDEIDTPYVLQPYDVRLYPGCTRRTYQNLAFIDTSLGRAIREFNSTLGIPRDTLYALKEIAIKCQACYCMFSPEGYNAHIVDKRCRNSTFHREVCAFHEADEETLRKLKLRSLTGHSDVHAGVEFAETPIGVAFLEFNSSIGVPMDVWVMITTAYVQCKTCHLTRTFPAHRGHTDLLGRCEDMGDGFAMLDKGKGKALDKGKGKAMDNALVEYESPDDVD
ncbi:hypothetical protein BJ912DRAFT_936184 [Pholiota molesta]|nr:hypothetical protein BJ912DRAFT_936184 [Pholiota molesta]